MFDFTIRFSIKNIMAEFDFIERIRRLIGVKKRDVVLGVGDDCAIIKGKSDILITIDSQVEDVHFKMEWGEPFKLGRRLVRINVSDIYAKGGIPKYALFSIGIDYKNKKEFVWRYIEGVLVELNNNDIQLIGGNVSSTSSKLFFDMVIIGDVNHNSIKRRDGAKVGDIIAVSGCLGDASAGLDILKKNYSLSKSYSRLVQKFYLPEVKCYSSKRIWSYVTSSIDISDGVVGDIRHILKASRCGAEIDASKVPTSKELRNYCNENGCDILDFALSGGEDYRLLVTLKRETPQKLIKHSGFHIIGEIIKTECLRINGVKKLYKAYEHF